MANPGQNGAFGCADCRIEVEEKCRYHTLDAFSAGDQLQRLKNQIGQWAVRILCAIALVFVGYAHQVPALAASELSPAELAQYVLPDGTLPTLCVTVDDGSGKEHGKIAHLNGCEACRISASVVLPTPADVVGARVGFVTTIELPLRAEVFYRQLFPPNTGPRAPPSNPILA